MLKLPLKLSTRERWAVVILTGFAASSASGSVGMKLFMSANSSLLPKAGDELKMIIAVIMLYGAGFIGGLVARIFSPRGNLWPLYAFSTIYIAISAISFALERLGDDPEPGKLILNAARVAGLLLFLILFARPSASTKAEPEEPTVS